MRHRSILLACSLLLPLVAVAAPLVSERGVSNEAQAHLTAGVCWKPVKGLTLSLDEQFRLKENFTKVDRFNTEVSLQYKPWKYIRLGAAYRLQVVAKDAQEGTLQWNLRHRASAHVAGVYAVGRWHLSLREKFQSTWRDKEITNLHQTPVPSMFLRTRFKVEYHAFAKPVQPYLALELYAPLNQTAFLTEAQTTTQHQAVPYKRWAFNELDTRIGVEWRIDAFNFIDFYYRLNAYRGVDVNQKGTKIRLTPQLDHVLGIAYSYHF